MIGNTGQLNPDRTLSLHLHKLYAYTGARQKHIMYGCRYTVCQNRTRASQLKPCLMYRCEGVFTLSLDDRETYDVVEATTVRLPAISVHSVDNSVSVLLRVLIGFTHLCPSNASVVQLPSC